MQIDTFYLAFYGTLHTAVTKKSFYSNFLVKDTNQHVIAKSLQLIVGRTAQEYNLRKQRKGAFREDRYHATVIESDEHFFQCLICIEINMVRADVVKHPTECVHGGYREIRQPPRRYRIIDTSVLMDLGGFNDNAMQQQLPLATIKLSASISQNQ